MNYATFPSAKLQTHLGYPVLDSRILSTNGTYKRIILWLPNHVDVPHGRYIHGYTGRETEVIFDAITPSVFFNWEGRILQEAA